MSLLKVAGHETVARAQPPTSAPMRKEHDSSGICRETEDALKTMRPHDQFDGLF